MVQFLCMYHLYSIRHLSFIYQNAAFNIVSVKAVVLSKHLCTKRVSKADLYTNKTCVCKTWMPLAATKLKPGKISKSYFLTPPHPQGSEMSVKLVQHLVTKLGLDKLTVQVWLLFDHQNFNFCSLYVSRMELLTNKQTDGWMDKLTDDQIPRCSRQTFQAGCITKTIELLQSRIRLTNDSVIQSKMWRHSHLDFKFFLVHGQLWPTLSPTAMLRKTWVSP